MRSLTFLSLVFLAVAASPAIALGRFSVEVAAPEPHPVAPPVPASVETPPTPSVKRYEFRCYFVCSYRELAEGTCMGSPAIQLVELPMERIVFERKYCFRFAFPNFARSPMAKLSRQEPIGIKGYRNRVLL